MGIEKVEDSFENLEKAFNTLTEAINFANCDETIKRDAVIKRFEYTIELFWKTFKRYLSLVGFSEKLLLSPKDVMKQAYLNQIINSEEAWLGMLNDRNILVHVYDEDQIKIIYKNILSDYYSEMKVSFDKLKKELNK